MCCQKSSQKNSPADMEFKFMECNPRDKHEWEYEHRREMQEVIPGLYLGPFRSATRSKLTVLQATGITHIICVRHVAEGRIIKPTLPDYFQYLVLEEHGFVDTENVLVLLPQFRNFVNDCLKSGGKVLVHGNSGICRSAALVIAYVMERTLLSARESYERVFKERACLCISQNYMQKLEALEPVFKARDQLQVQNLWPTSERNKRKFEELEK